MCFLLEEILAICYGELSGSTVLVLPNGIPVLKQFSEGIVFPLPKREAPYRSFLTHPCLPLVRGSLCPLKSCFKTRIPIIIIAGAAPAGASTLVRAVTGPIGAPPAVPSNPPGSVRPNEGPSVPPRSEGTLKPLKIHHFLMQ